MQISMDILSLVAPKADTGAGSRQRAEPNSGGGIRFDKLFENALTGAEPLTTGRKQPIKMAVGEADARIGPQKTEEDPDAAIAAAIMGNQEKVVIILEGDKESAVTPETSNDAIPVVAIRTEEPAYPFDNGTAVGEKPVDNTVAADAYPPDFGTDPHAGEIVPEKAAVTDTAAESDASGVTDAAASQTEINETPVIAKKPVNSGTSGTAKEANAANDEKATGSVEGEATARMPIVRTSERQENKESNSEFSEKGDLGPLENENDKTPVKGQKEKTYSETANAVRNRAEGAREHANNTPPLAQGIKPEQFKADQEMKQIAPNAPVRTENLFEEMVSRIETMQTDSTRTMTIQLKPEFLGKVALEIAMDAAGLHVRINAANSDVRSMISGQINALIESLEHKGI